MSSVTDFATTSGGKAAPEVTAGAAISELFAVSAFSIPSATLGAEFLSLLVEAEDAPKVAVDAAISERPSMAQGRAVTDRSGVLRLIT